MLKAKAVHLMDGSRLQADIASETGIDRSDLSKCVKALRKARLLDPDEGHPKLVIPIPPDFFERDTSA